MMQDNSPVLWEVDNTITERISKILDVNFAKYGIAGHWMAAGCTKMTCQNCGKESGLDDFIHTAQKAGVHSREFMLKAFLDSPHSDGTPHSIDCSECDTTYMRDGKVAMCPWHICGGHWDPKRVEGWKRSDVEAVA